MKFFNRHLLNIFLISFLISCSQPRTQLGLKNGLLRPCPGKPNCVVSQHADKKHFIQPIKYQLDKKAAQQKLIEIITLMPRTKLVEEKKDYYRAESKSKFFGFVDDMEFLFLKDKLIHIRSAAQVGYSDFGVNRKRLESIRKKFNQN